MSAPKYEKVPIESIEPDPANARVHGVRNLEAIRASLQAFGQQKPIVVDSRGIVLAGNGTLEAAKALGWTEIEIARSELTPVEAVAYGIADNRTSELADWNPEVLSKLLDGLDDELRDVLDFPGDELAELSAEPFEAGGEDQSEGEEASEIDPSVYTDKITAPIYEPRGERPEIEALFDDRKTKELVEAIDRANIPPAVSHFLRRAAERHTRFDFEMIAEFYAHAEPEIKTLMERSALVIIDFDAAVENGFVRMTKEIAGLAAVEEEAETDAE